MRTHTLCALALALVALHPAEATAHRFGHPTVPQNEFVFGMGWAEPRETSLFNIRFDSEVHPDLAYKWVFYHNTTDNVGFGLHFDWSRHDVDPVTVEDEFGNVFDVFFRLDSYNLGPRVRFTARGLVSPYLNLGMNYSFGNIAGSDVDFRRLSYDGFTMSAAFGISLVSAQWLDLSGEAFYTGGWASWADFPFVNSSSRDLDPAKFGFIGNVMLRF